MRKINKHQLVKCVTCISVICCCLTQTQQALAQSAPRSKPFTVCLTIQTEDLAEAKAVFITTSRTALRNIELIDFQTPIDPDHSKSVGCKQRIIEDGRVPILNGKLTYFQNRTGSNEGSHILSFHLDHRYPSGKWKLEWLFDFKAGCRIGSLDPHIPSVGVTFNTMLSECLNAFESEVIIKQIANNFLAARVDTKAACLDTPACISIDLARNKFWFLLLASARLTINADTSADSDGQIKDICSEINNLEVLSFVPKETLPPGKGSLEIAKLNTNAQKRPNCKKP